jgi:hypothetical protein
MMALRACSCLTVGLVRNFGVWWQEEGSHIWVLLHKGVLAFGVTALLFSLR